MTRPLLDQITRARTTLISRNHRRNFSALILFAITFALSAALAGGQTGPVFRTFVLNSVTNFRVELRARIETELQKPMPVGAKTFLQPVASWIQQDISWQATRTVVSVSTDGSAAIEEKLSEISGNVTSSDDTEEKAKLLADLESALNKWNSPKTLQYREMRTGQISGLGADAAPPLGEATPRVLTAWLVRALRPATALPSYPLSFGEHWQEARMVEFPEWSKTTASEAGEWIGSAPGTRQRGEPTVKLQTTQEISGAVSGGTEMPAEGSATAHFHAESLSTLAFDDLRLISASRSATRDIVWTLAPVEGLAKSPQYRGRLFVEISIQVCDENPCTVVNGRSRFGSR